MWTENKSVIYTTAREDDVSAKGGTAQDRKDMWRVGRQQELNRNFRFLSVLGFTAVLMCTWEAVLLCVSLLPALKWDRQHTYRNSGASYGLINGGKGGMIYTYLGGLVGFSFVILSMAEMASMAPTSGGQYHWVSEFAPPSCQCILSYITGWVCVLGWHTGIAGCCYTVANMMVGVVAINYPDSYTYEPWHVTLLVIAVALVALLFNTLLAQKLPLIEGMILIIHCFGFFGILIPLWVLSPRPAASDVFGSIEDRGGWGNNGLACLVGLVGPIYALIVQLKGPDSAVHMSEEIRDASRVLPLGMIWTLILNGSTGLVMIVTLAFCVGDIDHVLESQTGFAFIQVFLNSTGSVRAATGMTVVIMVMQFCAAISNVATTSRQIYAFARDKGLPFSNFLSKVNPTFMVPLNALCVSLAIVSLLSLVNIGSSVAFNAIMSLGTAALLSSYIVSITCVRIRRWRNQPLPPARWSMGRFTPFVDTVSILVLIVIWVFSFFPLTAHVNSTNMNWGVVIFGGVILLCLVYYQLRAKTVYKGPVTRILQALKSGVVKLELHSGRRKQPNWGIKETAEEQGLKAVCSIARSLLRLDETSAIRGTMGLLAEDFTGSSGRATAADLLKASMGQTQPFNDLGTNLPEAERSSVIETRYRCALGTACWISTAVDKNVQLGLERVDSKAAGDVVETVGV
ncbi:hypothetical protein CNMCM8980_004849 [Aspergillus fumigatiaffinis]|nr:hypothetical protein CNMCM8980_004849 [Aspergillus fumigatiaffinis]